MYVITGVTGHTGKVAAEALLARGEKVRVVVRDATKGEAFAEKGAEVAVADLGDAAALTNALTGAKGAYLLLPPNMAAADFLGFQRATAESIASAVHAARVPHVVLLSSIGADKPSGNGPIAGIHRLEQAINANGGTALTAIRAGYFMENIGGSLGALAHGQLPSFFPADWPMEAVATKDIGELAASLLLEGGKGFSVVELSSPLSHNQIADAIGRITGKRPVVAVYPAEAQAQTLQGYGLPAQISGLYQEMTLGFLSGHITKVPGARHIAGKTPVDDVLRGMLGA